MSPADISWLAGQLSKLPPFLDGVAVLGGSVAWGQPTWRSDIDVVMFATETFPDITAALNEVILEYENNTNGTLLLPKVDTVIVGSESERLITRDNLVRGSAPITESQTVREVFKSTSLRFSDHIGSLALTKGEPWRAFHSAYLSSAPGGREIRREEIRTYVTSFADSWRQQQQPLRSLSFDSNGNVDEAQLDMMGFVENFSIHLMRQILAERGCYPSPDRTPDVSASFKNLSTIWSENILMWLYRFLHIGEEYLEIIGDCKRPASPISSNEYWNRLVDVFDALPFADVEEAVWYYLNATG